MRDTANKLIPANTCVLPRSIKMVLPSVLLLAAHVFPGFSIRRGNPGLGKRITVSEPLLYPLPSLVQVVHGVQHEQLTPNPPSKFWSQWRVDTI